MCLACHFNESCLKPHSNPAFRNYGKSTKYEYVLGIDIDKLSAIFSILPSSSLEKGRSTLVETKFILKKVFQIASKRLK